MTRERFSTVWILAAVMLAVLTLTGCGRLASPPVFQPLTLDLGSDLAPRDPAAVAGPDIYCAAGNGTAYLGGQWRPFKSTGFILPGNGMMSSIRLAAVRGHVTGVLRGYFDGAGQRMVFCPMRDGPSDAVVDCASLYVMEDDLAMAIKRTFDVPDAIQNGHITCAYRQEKLHPL